MGIMLACAAVLFAMLFRLPGGAAIERSAEVSAQVAELALWTVQPGDLSRRTEIVRKIDTCVEGLRRALARDGLAPARMAEFESLWSDARLDAAGTGVKDLLTVAHDLTAEVRSGLDARHRRLEVWVKVLTGTLVLLMLVPLYGLVRQRRRVRDSLSQFSDDLGNGDWQDAVQALRNDRRVGAPSAFDALATGVAGVLGESDRRWQALADLSADWYWESDAQHRISRLFGSVAVFTGLGWQADDVIGWRHDQIAFFRTATGKDGWIELRNLLERGAPLRDFEFNIVSRDRRSQRWVAVSARARTNAAGRFTGYEGIGRDVTDRKRALSRLKSSEQRWATMVRLASDWYWETDERHRLLPMTSEPHRRIAEFADPAEGRTLWDAFPSAMPQDAWDALRADLDAQRPFRSVELALDTGDGGRLWLSISGVPRVDAQGRLRGFHGVGRDVTERKEAERVLLRHNEELQRAVAERTHALQAVNLDLDAFSRQLAHELRTPIGHVQGLAHLLQARAGARLADEDRHLLDLQAQAATAMRDTVDALLHLARSTMQPMPTESTDLSVLAHEVIDSLPPIQRAAPVRWTVQPAIHVDACPGALKIVLVNLLGNAAKFTRRAAEPAVHVSARALADGRVQITVEDNGVGFDPAQAGRLFTPFGRLHAGEDYHGTGIGLTIVQRIVERHGGSVQAASGPGIGARFVFTLAMRKVPAPASSSPSAPPGVRAFAAAGKPVRAAATTADQNR